MDQETAEGRPPTFNAMLMELKEMQTAVSEELGKIVGLVPEKNAGQTPSPEGSLQRCRDFLRNRLDHERSNLERVKLIEQILE